MRLFAFAAASFLAFPVHAEEAIEPHEIKCSQGEGRTRMADISVTIVQEAEEGKEAGDFKTAPKAAVSELGVTYCFDEKKGGVERRQLDFPVPLAAGLRLERVNGSGRETVKSEAGSSSGYLGARFGFLDGKSDPGTSCDKGIACRRFYYMHPNDTATMTPMEFSARQQCNPVVRGYAKGLLEGELKKLLPGASVGEFVPHVLLCTEYVSHVPGSKKMHYRVHLLAQAPLTR